MHTSHFWFDEAFFYCWYLFFFLIVLHMDSIRAPLNWHWAEGEATAFKIKIAIAICSGNKTKAFNFGWHPLHNHITDQCHLSPTLNQPNHFMRNVFIWLCPFFGFISFKNHFFSCLSLDVCEIYLFRLFLYNMCILFSSAFEGHKKLHISYWMEIIKWERKKTPMTTHTHTSTKRDSNAFVKIKHIIWIKNGQINENDNFHWNNKNSINEWTEEEKKPSTEFMRNIWFFWCDRFIH